MNLRKFNSDNFNYERLMYINQQLNPTQGARNSYTILYRVLEISAKTYNLQSRKSKFLTILSVIPP